MHFGFNLIKAKVDRSTRQVSKNLFNTQKKNWRCRRRGWRRRAKQSKWIKIKVTNCNEGETKRAQATIKRSVREEEEERGRERDYNLLIILVWVECVCVCVSVIIKRATLQRSWVKFKDKQKRRRLWKWMGNERVRDNEQECFNEWASICACMCVCVCVNLCECVRNIGPRGSCNCRLRSDCALK